MSATASPDISARFRRITSRWRMVFVLYALALTTGTHWPRLQLAPEIPASDKTIHMLAFATLALLLWRTRWVRNIWIVGLITLIWAAFDEISQGIPVLHRTVSGYDMAANALGVFAAMACILARRRMRRGLPANGA